MAIQLVTFGGLHAVDANNELDRLLAQHSRAALFVFLAIERRVSREALTAFFWPESDGENARHALRQSLYQLRKAVGSEWIESRAHELIVTGDIRVDAHDFVNDLERGDIASAVRLYRGAFLDGVHLVDLQSWEGWVDGRRAHYGRLFRKACRNLLDERWAARDLTGAVEAAEWWTARDPWDDEAQHRLIEALAAAGERAEAIRQYETYSRALEADGAQPPGETLELAERLRSEPAALPIRPPATATVEAPPPRQRPAPRGQDVPTRSPAATDDDGTTPSPAIHERTGVRRRRRWLAPAALTLVLIFAAAWGLDWSRLRRGPAKSASAIVVFPFSVRGADAVGYLSEGIVNLLGAALDGAGSLRPVDNRAVFGAVAEAGGTVPDAEHARRLAARLGASRFVLGDVVEAGGRLQIEAAVYDANAGCSSRARLADPLAQCSRSDPTTRAVVSGPADSVFRLVDELAARLLGELGDPAADRLLRTASLTTASLPAFKAYLQGEGLMRAGKFEQAAEAYLAAIASDSAFAVAYYRLGLAREWAPLPGEDRAAALAARYGERLSARDRRLLEAFRQWRTGDAAQAERNYREIVARYPDDVDAWFQLGEILFHQGPLLGHPIGESEPAWRKVLSYEPRNLFAVTHLARIALVGRRLDAVDSLLAPYPPDELERDRRLAEIVLLRAVARADTATSRAVAEQIRAWEGLSVWRVAVFLTAFSPDPVAMSETVRDLMDDEESPALRADTRWFVSLLDLAAGRFDAARSALVNGAAAERAVPLARRRRGFPAVTEWFAATLPLPYADSTLSRVRREASSFRAFSSDQNAEFMSETGLGAPIQLEPLRQYTLGVISLRLGDTTSAATAAAALRRLAATGGATILTRDLDRGLRARLSRQAGRADEALRVLDSLESQDMQGEVAATPFASRASERYLRGELLTSLGRDVEALRWFAALGDGSVTEVPLRALSHLRQAEIHERIGRRDEAARHYTRVVELWRDASPEFQPLVEQARRRRNALTPP